MKNKHINKVLTILGIIAVAFSVFAFLMPFSKDGVFWTAYIFEIIAILIQIPIFNVCSTTKKWLIIASKAIF